MSSRKSRSSSASDDDELVRRILKLRAEINQNGSTKASASRILKETCKCVKRLSKEVDNLSERISELIGSSDGNDAEIIRKLLQ